MASAAAVVVPNPMEGTGEDSLVVPHREDGSPYRFEMLFNGMVDRAYADTAAALLDCLIPRYVHMSEGERLAARLQHAVRTQVTVQADINWHHRNLVDCTPDEQAVLTASRATPPLVAEWASQVPLVLVDAFYSPIGALPQPTSALADVTDPPNLFWLRVEDEHDYLVSLARVGLIVLNEHRDYTA